MTSLKICGIQNADTLPFLGAKVAYAGFVFHRPSRRFVTTEQATTLARAMPPHIKKVGVFVDPEDDFIMERISTLDLVQLHGNESAKRVSQVQKLTAKPVIKAIKITKAPKATNLARKDSTKDYVKDSKDSKKHTKDYIKDYIADYINVADYIMLDGGMGDGVPFDWRICEQLELPSHWFLAGGINENNIHQAMKTTASVLDVSSGAEDSQGQKSSAKIEALMEALTKKVSQ